jgi:radical SAM/Cys-rich protein
MMLSTIEYLRNTDFPSLRRDKLDTLQVNLGYRCNQQCLHCHVDASPRRKEVMQRDTIDDVIEFVEKQGIATLDLTGGAPEINPHFMDLVSTVRAMGVRVMDRCNLTILEEPGYEELASFLAENHVEIIASLPCYLEENVNTQRGSGVFNKSVSALQKLNSHGYGEGGDLILNLVYNPQGASLPPPQTDLEAAYKKVLAEDYAILFDQLFTLANMPIKRFGSTLLSKGEFNAYMNTLKTAYKAENLGSVMCKKLISVDWQGYVYDCDFNQMLGLDLGAGKGRTHIRDIMTKDIDNEPIVVMAHCYGCTAGQGSSCGGALS